MVISLDHLKAQAIEFGHSQAREAAYLLVHSLCHLMGYDHMEEEEKRLMREKEEEILNSVGLTREGVESISDETLLSLAREAMTRSYSPYSHYPVGAALHALDGRIFQGCNIENASLGATICSERTAMVKAVSEGAHSFVAVAIAADKMAWPCGACRQVLNEFAPEIRVLVTDAEGHVEQKTLQELLPNGFGPKQLLD